MADSLVILTTLTKKDFNENVGGWICNALKIPSATAKSIYVQGKVASQDDYTVNDKTHVIRWKGQTPTPTEIACEIEIASGLTTPTITAWIAAFAGIASATITAIGGYLTKGHG